MSQSTIRIGIVGLSTSPIIFGGWGAHAHLPALLASPHYKLVAVANSTVESAKKSIEHHKLGSDVKAYGSPEDIAQDPDVDLVVVCVMVDTHYNLTKPALLAGKNVYVEWPLATSTAEAEELAELASSKNVKTIVGTQGRADPVTVKLRELISGGKIGSVISVNAIAVLNAGFPMDKWLAGMEWYVKKESAGNIYKISFAHFYESFLHIFGEFSTFSSILENRYNTVALVDMATGQVVDPAYPRTSPDQVLLQGILKSGAVASVSARMSNNLTVDSIGYRWIITGTEGEIEVTAPYAQWQGSPAGKKIKVTVGQEGKTEEVAWDENPAYFDTVPDIGKNVAAVYRAFAEGRKEDYTDFNEAVVLHRLLDNYAAAAENKTIQN
ncbi:hypothetical protein BP6252_12003 [Coleophoma cylindrospora]|uniref:Gfo/Idh/MocA-like oxidoreductase N-terminal domain-containing protein n=1 Tax=Coleophoma cylindrospora TaxID=1849047 RepID=A0A3D8QG19_9HELO|nr:hypothetical protein BP6252_12003 [Coleophoma cylindrospora]